MRRGILEAAPARAATDPAKGPGPARCLRGAVGEPERRLEAPLPVHRSPADVPRLPAARALGPARRRAPAGVPAQDDARAVTAWPPQARRPGCVFGAYAPAALSGRSRRAAIRSRAATVGAAFVGSEACVPRWFRTSAALEAAPAKSTSRRLLSIPFLKAFL